MVEGTASAPISITPPAIETAGTKPGSGTPEKPATPYAGTKHSVTIDGVTEEIDYETLKADYQRAKASDKKFKEAQAIQQATSDLLTGLAGGDDRAWTWFKTQVPKDVFKKVAFDFAHQEMEFDSLPPEEKRKLDLDEREKRLKEDEEKREQDGKQKAWQSEVQSAGDHIQKQLDEFVERSGKQPSSEQLLRMSEYMLAHIRKNNALPPVEDLYKYTERQMELDAQGYISKKSSDIQGLLKWMDPAVIKAIKKSFIEESEGNQPKRASSGPPVPRERGELKKVGIDEAFSLLEKRMKKGR